MYVNTCNCLNVPAMYSYMLHTCNYVFHCVSAATAALDKICVEMGVDCTPPRTTARLLDKVRMNPVIVTSS